MPVTVVWGLKRSGIHYVVNWLYANFGGTAKDPITGAEVHPQLRDGFRDQAAGVAFHNNCGGLHSRQFSLGSIDSEDLTAASRLQATTIFGLEDCDLRFATRLPSDGSVANVLILRDPLNNIASRLEGAKSRPEVFRVDKEYVALLASYCEEFLGSTNMLDHKTVVDFNRFVIDRGYRDSVASDLGVHNVDAVSEVSDYGGGSSFSTSEPDAAALLSRYEQHPVPGPIVEMLLAQPAVVEVCSLHFGFDLAERAGLR